MTDEKLRDYIYGTCPYCNSSNTDCIDDYDYSTKHICHDCHNDFIIEYDDTGAVIDVTDRHRFPITYTWKDLVCVDGTIYALEFPISGKIDMIDDDDFVYDISDFYDAVADMFDCKKENIRLFTMDTKYFEQDLDLSDDMSFGAESCGCYINGTPEWILT